MNRKKGASRLRIWFAGLLAVVFLTTGCGGGGGVEDNALDACSGLVEGTAFYPYYEGGSNPVYYADGNHDILVSLYDEFDRIVSDVVTGPSGFYEFDHLPPGYYYVMAQAETYMEADDVFDIYVDQTPLFWVAECDWIDEMNLFLEYSHSEF